MPRFPFAQVFLALAAFGLPACTDSDGPLPTQIGNRGRVMEVRPYASYSVAEVESIMGTVHPSIPQLIPPTYGVDMYVVLYETPGARGEMTYASGLLAMPVTEEEVSFPMISYQHGTVLHKEGVATRGEGEWQLGAIMATDGYICAMPDYLGLGYGPGFHPYIHAKTEASAVIDMLRASRTILKDKGVDWNEQLYLVGYSQGGHATMAAHREIQMRHKGEFEVTASAPMAGPYDASGVQEKVITGQNPYPTPGYLPYIVYSYDLVYNIVKEDPSTLFKAPYDSIVAANMNQVRGIGYLNSLCDPIPRRMMKDSVMAAYEADPHHPLKVALRDNDLWDWVPQTHMRLFYCTADDQVSYENSIVAYNHFMQAGGDPALIKPYDVNPNANHGDCAMPALLLGKFFFDSIASVTPVD